jgi:hypothetical protein
LLEVFKQTNIAFSGMWRHVVWQIHARINFAEEPAVSIFRVDTWISSEAFVPVYQTVCRYVSEDHNPSRSLMPLHNCVRACVRACLLVFVSAQQPDLNQTQCERHVSRRRCLRLTSWSNGQKLTRGPACVRRPEFWLFWRWLFVVFLRPFRKMVWLYLVFGHKPHFHILFIPLVTNYHSSLYVFAKSEILIALLVYT